MRAPRDHRFHRPADPILLRLSPGYRASSWLDLIFGLRRRSFFCWTRRVNLGRMSPGRTPDREAGVSISSTDAQALDPRLLQPYRRLAPPAHHRPELHDHRATRFPTHHEFYPHLPRRFG